MPGQSLSQPIRLRSPYGFTPALRRIAIIGHHFVKADWNRFKPTKAVNKYQYEFTQYPNASESKTKAPAIIRRERSTVMTLPPFNV
jgi:hypothetical protein